MILRSRFQQDIISTGSDIFVLDLHCTRSSKDQGSAPTKRSQEKRLYFIVSPSSKPLLIANVYYIRFNSSRADFRFIGKSKKFRIAIPSSITRVSLCQPDFAVISILYSMPISDFSVPISINRFTLAASFYREHHVLVQWQGLENSFRNSLSLLSEILSNILNILHLELKLNHVVKKIAV